MDVFSLVKFWRNAGIGDPLSSTNFDDDDSSFFDLVFTNDSCVDSTTINIISDFHTNDHHQHQHHQQQESGLTNLYGHDKKSTSKSNHTYYYSCSSPHSMFFNKSKILPLDSSSSSSTRPKSSPKSPFRALKLGFQKTNKKMKHDILHDINNIKEQEVVTISSLLKRDNSLRNKLKSEDHGDHSQISSKRFSKEVVYKYLNIIKPSKRFNDKVQFMTSSPATTSIFSPRKYLGKSRSSSSSYAAVKPLPALRRDDSALQQQDGIQSAILHCKKSYSSPSQGCQVLSRSGSAPSHAGRVSVEEEKRSSI